MEITYVRDIYAANGPRGSQYIHIKDLQKSKVVLPGKCVRVSGAIGILFFTDDALHRLLIAAGTDMIFFSNSDNNLESLGFQYVTGCGLDWKLGD